MNTRRFANAHTYVDEFLEALARAADLRGPRTFIVEVRGSDLSDDEVSKLT